MKKLFNRKGFTLLETLIAVAVVVVLTGMAVPAIVNTNASLTAQQENDYAKSIFLAAQDNLTNMKTNGSLSKLSDETGASSVYDETVVDNKKTYTLKSDIEDIVDEEHADELRNNDTEHQYVVISNSDNGFDKVLPSTSIDSSILTGREITIIFNPVSGDIFCVRCSKNGSTGEYYGSVVNLDTSSIIVTPEVTLVNGEENIVQIYFPVPDDIKDDPDASLIMDHILDATIFNIKVYDSGRKNYFSYTFSNSTEEYKEYAKSEGFQINYATDTATWALDSLLEGYGFEERRTGAPKSSGIVNAGDNITVDVSYTANGYSGIDYDASKNSSASGNSLYALYANNTIVVRNGRHLQNLNSISDSLAATLAENGVRIVIGNDFSWAGGTVDYYRGKDSSFDKYFTPLKASKLFAEGSSATLTGDGHYIRLLEVEESNSNAGLFDTLYINVSNLELQDPMIKSGKNAGALAGTIKNATVGNCTVSIMNSSTVDSDILNGDKAVTLSGESIIGAFSTGSGSADSVGLLAGYAENATITNCSVNSSGYSVPSSGYNCGFVIGYTRNCTVSSVNATGTIQGGKCKILGGAIGLIQGGTYTDNNAYVNLYNIKSIVKSDNKDTRACPAGFGSIGKFVGIISSDEDRVTSGISGCSGTGLGSAEYQFLGELDYTSTPASLLTDESSLYKSDGYADGNIAAVPKNTGNDEDKDKDKSKFTAKDGKMEFTMSSSIDVDCITFPTIYQFENNIYYTNSGKHMLQYIGDEYYYNRIYPLTSVKKLEDGMQFLIVGRNGSLLSVNKDSNSDYKGYAYYPDVSISADRPLTQSEYDQYNSSLWKWEWHEGEIFGSDVYTLTYIGNDPKAYIYLNATSIYWGYQKEVIALEGTDVTLATLSPVSMSQTYIEGKGLVIYRTKFISFSGMLSSFIMRDIDSNGNAITGNSTFQPRLQVVTNPKDFDDDCFLNVLVLDDPDNNATFIFNSDIIAKCITSMEIQ